MTLAPVTIQAAQGLDFGAMTKPAKAASSTVTPDASNGSVTVSAAKFDLIGQAGSRLEVVDWQSSGLLPGWIVALDQP